ncbi:CD36 family [Phytophthora infestans]|uniref:CD36 family n=1 Tax=Phytophthora infestans TaxID=4787 RepID=A0A8S9TUE6_PHYIN|nr:CD36 family [Phytophthora infestans]
MFGVGLALALVACGVVFIVLGFHVQEAERKAQAALLFKWMPKPTAAETSAAFLNCSTFIFAMDAPEFTSFYLWNLTNAEDLLAGGGTIQPKLAQVGPYTYEKRTRKLNVSFHTIEDEAYDSDSYSAVSYQVASTYHFSAERSTGSESDLVVTLNASYVRHLTKLHAQTGRTERFLAAEFAHAHIRDYVRHLQSDFVAATKLRALRALLPEMMARVKREGMAAVINRQRRRVGDADLPAALVRMHAVARTEQIPVMLRDVYRDQTDVALPSLLTKQFGLARRQAVPRVLSNMLNRLHVEAVPALLGRQIETQQTNFVPRTLASLNIKMQRVAFPYVLQEVLERACLEVVPFVLRAIKNEIVARDVANNQATIDNAKLAVINLWRQQGSSPTDLDAWIDDSPTNQERTGFELLPATSSLELSLEAATLLLGSRPSNLRFSLVDYDSVQTATDGLETTATGFAIWKQVVALNETAIDCVIEGVNNDVEFAADYLTREQLMAIRDYIIVWAQSGIVQRNRQRYWRNAFAKRTISSDRSDPEVDLDLERVGIQAGFSLQPLSTSSGGTTVSADVAQQVWNSSSTNFSFVDPAGFTKWLGIVDGSTTASTSGLLAGVTGITSAEVSAILTWIKALLDDGFIRRRALRHWADGTCTTVMHLTRHNGCLRYDLEPNTDGLQLGFEMNPEAVAELGSGISENARNVLWDVTEGVSFLRPVHSSDTKYYAGWVRAIRTSNYARLIDDSQQLTTLAVTGVSAQAIGRWLRSWAHNELYKFTVYYWWLRSTCWPRVELSETQVGSATVTTGELECKETSTEQEQSTAATSANVSPFFTDVRTYQVTEVTCTTTGPTFTKTQTIYTRQARVFSCDMVSTSLADDQDDGTVGFELAPMAQNDAERISLAAAISLWNPVNELSFRNTQGYEKWVRLATHISEGTNVVAAETQAVADAVNDAIARTCEDSMKGGGSSSGVFNVTLIDTSCTQVTRAHVTKIAAWAKEQSSSQWVKNSLLDQWRRGGAGELDIEPYRDGLQSGLELTTGCETTLFSLSASECSAITSGNGAQYEVPREALDLWDATHAASILSTKGYALWEALAVAVAGNDGTSKDSAQKEIAKLCSSSWEIWMERVFQWLQRWKSNEHLERDVLGHWLYARCPTTPTTDTISEPAPQTSTVSSCTESYTYTLSPGLDEIQRSASRPVSFFNANITQEAALIQPTKTVDVTEVWTKCVALTPSSFTQTVRTRQSRKKYQVCNLLSVLATPDVDLSKVAPMNVVFELNQTTPVDISIEAAQVIWDAQSDFSLLASDSFFKKWYPAIDRSTALLTVQSDLDTLADSSTPSDLSVVQDYIVQWENSDAAALSVCSLWISTNVASVDVDVHQIGDQRGFELYRNGFYKGAVNSLTLPTLAQAKKLEHCERVLNS